MNDNRNVLSRRTVLRGTAVAVAAVGVGGPLLTACGGDGGGAAEAGKRIKLPHHVARDLGIKPDLPKVHKDGTDGYFGFPQETVKSVRKAPGKGGKVSGFVQTYTPVPPGVDRNKYWRALNGKLNVDLRMSVVGAGDYRTKIATLIAGDDLPDFTQIVNGAVPELAPFLEAKCQDLSEFLAGDEIKNYPNLANFPQSCWKVPAVNGGIYGLPIPRPRAVMALFGRDDLLEKQGIDPSPKTFDEFFAAMKAYTAPTRNRYALACPLGMFRYVQQMLGMPNNWVTEGGKLSSVNELEGTKDALAALARVRKAGLFHPDAFLATAPHVQWFNAGTVAFIQNPNNSWVDLYDQNVAGDSYRITGRPAFSFEKGVTPTPWMQDPSFWGGFSAIKKGSKDRTRELLDIANWLAAPIGSQEFLFRRYGLEGVHYTRDADGAPALNDKGKSETAIGVKFITDSPFVLTYPDNDDVVRGMHTFEKVFFETAVDNPVFGFYSPTLTRKGAQLQQIVDEACVEILQGRKPVSSWDDTMKTWRQSGGDRACDELQKAIEAG
ncbi:extracellular solute-binding protein [Streptomyces sp. NPDC019224]|uniref:extracellular solute-binding protein n=1 Tax=Streptomyces sp. NPDC019224 TaxID=3154484 RepID=UPI0033C669A4